MTTIKLKVARSLTYDGKTYLKGEEHHNVSDDLATNLERDQPGQFEIRYGEKPSKKSRVSFDDKPKSNDKGNDANAKGNENIVQV